MRADAWPARNARHPHDPIPARPLRAHARRAGHARARRAGGRRDPGRRCSRPVPEQAGAGGAAARAGAPRSLALCRPAGVPLIVNDDVELALAVDAAGVHLGTRGRRSRRRAPAARIGPAARRVVLQPARARARGGRRGRRLRRLRRRCSPRRPSPAAVRAPLALFREARRTLGVPIVAIGGITLENAPELLAAGADAIAVITALFDARRRRSARARESPDLFAERPNRMTRNDELFARRRRRVIPGGVNSPVRAFRAVGGTPRFFARGEGAYFWDVDGKRYIDYVGSWGPLILGHAHPQVVEAVRETRAAGPVLRRADRARDRAGGAPVPGAAEHGDGAPRLLGHRGDDDRAAARARVHRARADRQVRRLLPRPRRRAAREGGLGRAHARHPELGGRARRKPPAHTMVLGVQRRRRASRTRSASTATRSRR